MIVALPGYTVNFRENFIKAYRVKRQIWDINKSHLGHEIPISVNERVILPFREGFIFTKLRICKVSQK